MEKENKNNYTAIVIAIVFVIGLMAYSQYKISTTDSSLDKVALALATVQKPTQATSTLQRPNGISPQFGIGYDTAGYNTLLKHYNSINLDAEQSKNVAGLDVELPCCGFQKIVTKADGTADFPASCHCGHHDAMYGLAKYMVQKGYGREEMQKELDVWKEVFFPTQGGGNLGGCT